MRYFFIEPDIEQILAEVANMCKEIGDRENIQNEYVRQAGILEGTVRRMKQELDSLNNELQQLKNEVEND